MATDLPNITSDFQAFWRDFTGEMRLVKDFYISVSRLLLYYQQAPEPQRIEIINGLLHVAITEHTGYKIAWAALKQIQEPKAHTSLLINEGLKRMQFQQAGYEAAAILADIIYILGKEAPQHAKDIILQYLFEYPTGPYWTQVVWVIQDHYPDAFVAAWRRYFLSEPEENWKGTRLMNLFLPFPDAIENIQNAIHQFSEKTAAQFKSAIEEVQAADSEI